MSTDASSQTADESGAAPTSLLCMDTAVTSVARSSTGWFAVSTAVAGCIRDALPKDDDLSARDRLLTVVAGQLGNPHGALGRITGRLLNRGNRATIESAIRALDARPSEVLADLGFGGGEGLAQLLKIVDARGSVVGVDRSSTMLNAARRRFRREIAAGHLQLHEGSMEKLPLAEQSIDAAISVNTVYFVPDLALLFQELARVLRPNGRVTIGVADPAAMERMPFTPHGFILRPIDEITTIAKTAAGLTLSDSRLGKQVDSYHLLSARIRES